MKNFCLEIRKIGWVKKAIMNFRQNSSYRKPDQLKKIHYQIIGDQINENRPGFNKKTKGKVFVFS